MFVSADIWDGILDFIGLRLDGTFYFS
jgi:hypothetical protein